MFVSLLSFPFPIPYMPINQCILCLNLCCVSFLLFRSLRTFTVFFLSLFLSLSLFISLSLFLRPAYKNNKQTKLNKHCKLSIFSTATLDSLPAYSRRKAENQQTFLNFQSPSAISVQYRCPVSGSGQCQPQAELYQ